MSRWRWIVVFNELLHTIFRFMVKELWSFKGFGQIPRMMLVTTSVVKTAQNLPNVPKDD